MPPQSKPPNASGTLLAVSDEEMLAAVRRYLPLIPDATLLAHIRVFRQICHQHKVLILRAQPHDFSIIASRKAIGWKDNGYNA